MRQTQHKQIILVLDESGSMGSQRGEVIKGINDMINTQRTLQDKPVVFTIIKFNTTVKRVRSDFILNISPFSSDDYIPSGGTALYDAIGSTINIYRDTKDTIMIIVTDGQENSSREFTRSQMIKMIDYQREKNNWNFIYLSEDPTTVVQGDAIGLSNGRLNCSNSLVGQGKSGVTIGSNVLQQYISDVSYGKTSQNYDDYKKSQSSNNKSNFNSRNHCWK